MRLALIAAAAAAAAALAGCATRPGGHPSTQDTPGTVVTILANQTLQVQLSDGTLLYTYPPGPSHKPGIYVDPDPTHWPASTAQPVAYDYPMQMWVEPNGPWVEKTDTPIPPPRNAPDSGDVRQVSSFVKFAFIDPLVFPGNGNDPSHHHTFYGNAAVNPSTNAQTIQTGCNSASRGGTWDCGAAWHPSMIDTTTSLPIKPHALLKYYKSGNAGYMNLILPNGMREGDTIQRWPHGMQMLAGDSKSTGPQGVVRYQCVQPDGNASPGYNQQYSIPDSCPAPGMLTWTVYFPQCWDGVNLDSADHKSHMAYPIGDPGQGTASCPADHKVLLPQVTFIIRYDLPANGDISKWALASDMYAMQADMKTLIPGVPRGYSGHGDWMLGLSEEILNLLQANCYSKKADCGTFTPGDGRTAGEFGDN